MTMILALIQAESSGNDLAIGDNGNAFGCLQIHKLYVEDVNRILGYDKFTHSDAFDRIDSIHMFVIYTDHYATAKRIGREPTVEDKVRIHNGGPNGWKKQSTIQHWKKVKNILDDHARHPLSNFPQRKTSTRFTASIATKMQLETPRTTT